MEVKIKLLSAVFFVFILSTLYAQNSMQWRGENRDGIYKDKNLLKSWDTDGPKLLWHFEGLG